MPEDKYHGNSQKQKNKAATVDARPEPVKLVSHPVGKKKKPLGSKLKEFFFAQDARSVAGYVVMEVLMPAARDLAYDMISKGAGRMMYGERGGRMPSGAPGMRPMYHEPVNRGVRGAMTVPYGQRQFQPQQMGLMAPADEFVLTNREDAEVIIDALNEEIQLYGFVDMYRLKVMLGLPATFTDQRLGWENLRGARMVQHREGWLMELPTPKQV